MKNSEFTIATNTKIEECFSRLLIVCCSTSGGSGSLLHAAVFFDQVSIPRMFSLVDFCHMR